MHTLSRNNIGAFRGDTAIQTTAVRSGEVQTSRKSKTRPRGVIRLGNRQGSQGRGIPDVTCAVPSYIYDPQLDNCVLANDDAPFSALLRLIRQTRG